MKLRLGDYTFDWWTFGLGSIERGRGLVALVARRPSDDDAEVLDAVVTDDMNAAVRRLVDAGRLRDYPGAVVGILTLATSRAEAAGIADELMRRRWIRPVETDGSVPRGVMSGDQLRAMAAASMRAAL